MCIPQCWLATRRVDRQLAWVLRSQTPQGFAKSRRFPPVARPQSCTSLAFSIVQGTPTHRRTPVCVCRPHFSWRTRATHAPAAEWHETCAPPITAGRHETCPRGLAHPAPPYARVRVPPKETRLRHARARLRRAYRTPGCVCHPRRPDCVTHAGASRLLRRPGRWWLRFRSGRRCLQRATCP